MRHLHGLAACALLAGCTYQPELHFMAPHAQARIVLSSGFNEKNEPVDEIQRISLDKKVFAAHITLYELDERAHQMSCRFINAKGYLAALDKQDIPANSTMPVTKWCGYDFKPYDQHGRWHVEIWLDNLRISRKTLLVDPVPLPDEMPPVATGDNAAKH